MEKPTITLKEEINWYQINSTNNSYLGYSFVLGVGEVALLMRFEGNLQKMSLTVTLTQLYGFIFFAVTPLSLQRQEVLRL